MPFMNDKHNNWNKRWEDELNAYPEAEDPFCNDINIVTYNIPDPPMHEEPEKEKEPVFITEGKVPVIRAPYYEKEYIYSKKEFAFSLQPSRQSFFLMIRALLKW